MRESLDHSHKIAEIDLASYDVVFVAGGHAANVDLPFYGPLADGMSRAFAANKVIGGVCHGPAALASVKAPDGAPLVRGKRVTGFTDAEEETNQTPRDALPFFLEDRLKVRCAALVIATSCCMHVACLLIS